MLELLILLSSDISPYCDTFDMMHQYTWSLYRPISSWYTGTVGTLVQLVHWYSCYTGTVGTLVH